MPTTKTARKYYLREATLVDGIIADEALVTGKTNSALIEEHILHDIAVTPISLDLTRQMYAHGLFSSLAALLFSADSKLEVGKDIGDLKEFVLFMHDAFFMCGFKSPDEFQRHDLINYLDSLLETLKEVKSVEERKPVSDRRISMIDLNLDIKVIEVKISELEEDARLYQPIDIAMIVIDSWEFFKGMKLAYRVLRIACETCNESSITPEKRLEFIKLLNTLPTNWGE